MTPHQARKATNAAAEKLQASLLHCRGFAANASTRSIICSILEPADHTEQASRCSRPAEMTALQAKRATKQPCTNAAARKLQQAESCDSSQANGALRHDKQLKPTVQCDNTQEMRLLQKHQARPISCSNLEPADHDTQANPCCRPADMTPLQARRATKQPCTNAAAGELQATFLLSNHPSAGIVAGCDASTRQIVATTAADAALQAVMEG
jgi:hypothetical protein